MSPIPDDIPETPDTALDINEFTCEDCGEVFTLTDDEIDDGVSQDVCEKCQVERAEAEEKAKEEEEDDEDEELFGPEDPDAEE